MSHYTGSVPDRGRATDWRDLAACRAEDSELFFPKGTEGPWAIQIEEAKAVCRRCPVMLQCRQWALSERIEHGVWGGLAEADRRSILRRRAARNAGAPKPRPPQYPTLRALFEANTRALPGGHLAWTGPSEPGFGGRCYNPKQVAFIIDRDREPEGRVLTDCGRSGCVLPAHVADDAERMRCGTRAGYQRHLRARTTICGPCRQANTDGDNQLRRTGSTRVAV